jgi:hypothetical protein
LVGDAAGGRLPPLGESHWPAGAYERAALDERVLAFGTGMLLRSLPIALLDAANRAGRAPGARCSCRAPPRGSPTP